MLRPWSSLSCLALKLAPKFENATIVSDINSLESALISHLRPGENSTLSLGLMGTFILR